MSIQQAGVTQGEVTPRGERIIPVDEGSEAFVELLNANEVDYIFLNPGTDTTPIQEALSKYQAQGKRAPQVITSLHEHQAMAAAHGHFVVSGKPQVVMVHVDCGTQNVGGALHQAWRGQAGVIFCAGRTPVTFDGEVRGGRNTPVHWIQETFDQASNVRGYVKWDYEIRRPDMISHALQRSFQIANSEPHGPIYLTMSREVLMEKTEKVKLLPKGQYRPAASPQADPFMLTEAAKLLIRADNPVILVALSGRHKEAVQPLVQLAELLAIPVVENRSRVNFPSQHPLHLGYYANPYLEKADVVLIIDNDVPYVISDVKLRPEVKIIQLDIDPIKETIPMWGFPVDLPIKADSSLALPALGQELAGLISAADKVKIETRRANLQAEHEAQRSRWKQIALDKSGQKPIAAEWLSYLVGQVISDDMIVTSEVVSDSVLVNQYLERNKPGTFFRSYGSSLGWGLAAGLGAKLAAPEETVVCLTSDGSFNYAHPIACLWAADVYKAPFLTVIFNNQCYYATKSAFKKTYADGFSLKTGEMIGTDIYPPPNYELVAKACRAYAETVENPSEILPALKRALEEVRSGRPAVLDVIIACP